MTASEVRFMGLADAGQGGTKLDELISELFAADLAAHLQMWACEVHFASAGLPRLASFFRVQAEIEKAESWSLLERSVERRAVVAPRVVAAPTMYFGSDEAPARLAWELARVSLGRVQLIASMMRAEDDVQGPCSFPRHVAYAFGRSMSSSV